jgi:hypothetical protein
MSIEYNIFGTGLPLRASAFPAFTSSFRKCPCAQFLEVSRKLARDAASGASGRDEENAAWIETLPHTFALNRKRHNYVPRRFTDDDSPQRDPTNLCELSKSNLVFRLSWVNASLLICFPVLSP